MLLVLSMRDFVKTLQKRPGNIFPFSSSSVCSKSGNISLLVQPIDVDKGICVYKTGAHIFHFLFCQVIQRCKLFLSCKFISFVQINRAVETSQTTHSDTSINDEGDRKPENRRVKVKNNEFCCLHMLLNCHHKKS